MVLMKVFNLTGLHLLGPPSMAWAFVLVSIVRSVVYNIPLSLQPSPMAQKHQIVPRMTLPEPKVVKNCLSYVKTKFSYYFSTKTGSSPDNSTKSGASATFGKLCQVHQ